MDKYQNFLLEYVDFTLYANRTNQASPTIVRSRTYLQIVGDSVFEATIPIFNGSTITVRQSTDIDIIDYLLELRSRTIEAVYALKGAESVAFAEDEDNRAFRYPTSFDNKIDSIKIVFKNNFADDLILPVVYEEADKSELAKQRMLPYIKKARIEHQLGTQFVDIYFELCDECCSKTEITLYTIISNENRLFGAYEYDRTANRCRIENLACGKYSYIVKQFDESGNLFFETDPRSFCIGT